MAAYRESVDTSAAYVPVDVDGLADEVAAPTAAPAPRRGLIAAALAATAVVAVGAATVARGGAQSHGLRQLPGTADLQIKAEATWVQGVAFPSQAPEMDVDVQYTDLQIKVEATWVQNGVFPSQAPEMDVDVQYIGAAGWGTNYDHIPTPEMCASMCQGVEKCNAYTWVKDAGLPGCPSQCWLMEGISEKKPLKGLVSGKPPTRKPFAPPPASKGAASGSLYCFALMVPEGYEEGLLKWQHDNKAGIFGCDQAAVYSNTHITIAPAVVTQVVNSTLKCGYGGDSMSALNAWIFIEVWRKLIAVGDYKKHDWVVKVDPDAVFFPDRLSKLLVKYQGAGYINNCRYGMHGPIELFSSRAIDVLAADYKLSWDGKAPKTCVTKMDFGQWGEDMFMDQCLSKILEVKPVPTDSTLMCESHCECNAWYWCNEGPDMVSYHPFKSIDSFKNCMANAMGSAGKETKHMLH
eukprot:CAMPEP_0183493308 /NCGR_PEP_ID=MMETSP0370-20130417/183381_1 /TAXON_ID=268820 /ORGANISM="Peridinium aciculiferum, Strain PAER-2" /LENGTH=462 /DNA_ID=CAMNT_0025686649 /DNA_START=56 /DNA_END=1444 /DNA_ORIENTATION=-